VDRDGHWRRDADHEARACLEAPFLRKATVTGQSHAAREASLHLKHVHNTEHLRLRSG
jgi:hypothetical protein